MVCSCTITKRVHRSGYHVEWKHNQKKISSTRNDNFQGTPIPEYESDESLGIPYTDPVPEEELESIEFNEIELELPEEESKSDQVRILNSKKSIKKTAFRASSKFRLKKIRPLFWRMTGQDLKGLGMTFMVIGGLFLLGAMLSAVGAFSGGSSSAGSDAGYYFFDALMSLMGTSGWLWLLIAVIVVILIIYLFVLLVNMMGGPFVGAIVGLSLFALGLTFYLWGKNRERIEG